MKRTRPALSTLTQKLIRRGPFFFLLAMALIAITLETAVQLLPAPSLARTKNLSPLILSDQGKILRVYLAKDDAWRLKLQRHKIPRHFVELLIAYEDKRFYRHGGVDGLAMSRAAFQTLVYGRPVSGASTLTMQTARLLSPRPNKRSMGRKILAKLRQIIGAWQLERAYSKAEILDIYLTLAPFGGNIEGLRAASLIYFGKEPNHLNLAQSALLVALPQAPEQRRPDRKPRHAKQARDRVLSLMAARELIPAKLAQRLKNNKIPQRRDMVFAAPHLADRFLKLARKSSPVKTLIDFNLQKKCEYIGGQALKLQTNRITRAGTNIAMLVVRNKDGAVRAYVGGVEYKANRPAGLLDLATATRSPGSTLKPFIYGLGFEKLVIHPQTIYTDAPIRFGQYSPSNFTGGFQGDISISQALIRSINTAAVSVLAKVGPPEFLARMRSIDLSLELSDTPENAGLAIALGGIGMSLSDLGKLYLALAKKGQAIDLRLLASDPPPKPQNFMAKDAAWAVTNILADLPPPSGFPEPAAAQKKRRIAYKTGTSYGFRDAWAIGYDRDHTVAIWIGNPRGTPNPGSYGITTAAPILFRVFDVLPNPHVDVAGPAPADSLLSQKHNLPSRLLRFETNLNPRDTSRRSLKIMFPHANSTLLTNSRKTQVNPIPLMAQGGQKPYRWFIDGTPLSAPKNSGQAKWIPEGRGDKKITVFDAQGHTVSIHLWIN